MTAEGTACNGAGEAPKAEFAAEKVVAAAPAAAAPEEKAPGEREGEDVGGPFVIVNGDSDKLSDRGSDLGKTPDEDSPSEEEEDAPGSNAAPDAAVGGDHGAAGGEVGAPGAALAAASLVDGRDCAAEVSVVGADEGKGEPSADFDAEALQQEAVGREQGVADTPAASGCNGAVTNADSDAPAVDAEVDGKEEGIREEMQEEAIGGEHGGEETLAASGSNHAVTDADSDAPVVDSEVDDKDATTEESAATDVAELLVPEAASTEQDVEVAAAELCGHDDALTYTDSSSAVMDSKVYVEDGKEEQNDAVAVEPMEQDTGGAGAFMANGHLCADTRTDSFEAAAEYESHADESKPEQNATEVGELVQRDAACGEQDGTDALQTNGHIHVAMNDDSCIVASESKLHANETKGKESHQEEERTPMTEAEVLEGVLGAAGRICADSVEEPIEEEDDVDGHSYAEVSADASGEPEAVIGKVEVEDTCSLLEQKPPAGVASSNEEVVVPVEEVINESARDVGELEEAAPDGLVKDEVSVHILHSLNPESDPSVESSREQEVQVEVSTGDESASESDLKADNVVEVNIAASLLSQENCDSAVETVEREQLEAPGVGQANEIENDVAKAEPKKEMEVVDTVPLQAAADSAASTFHNEPRSIHLDTDSFKHSSPPATELESCEDVCTEESRSREISDTTVDQFVPGASVEHGSTAVHEAELTFETRAESQDKPSGTAVDQGEPVALNVDELVVVECSSRIGSKGSSPSNEDSCKDICSENVNASSKSSDEVGTKCLEALEPSSADMVSLAEHKVDDEHARDEETKHVEDSSELHGDLDKNNTGDAQVIRQQKVYMIKVPRFSGEDLWAKIHDAHLHLDQLTQKRDAINSLKQKQKAVCDQYREKLEAARREEREARAAHGDKKNDLNSVRSVIGKLNQANSIEEIDEMIATKEKIMQHETISLKEEKLLIKEINELKSQRKQLCSNMGSKAEINEAFDQKDHIHERHKTLKKDSDVLFTNLKSLEENTRKIQKTFEDERIVLRKLNDEYRAANEMRQKAYSEWSELKAEPFKKNKYFCMYKDNRKIAGEYESSGDMYGLQLFCNNQVERVMEIWNKGEDFRKKYVESNKVSTLRRLGTHDGRRLGPDEDPPVIPSRRPSNPSSSLTVSSPNVPILTSVAAPVLSTPVSDPVKEDSFPVLPSSQISKRVKSKESGSSAQNEKIAVTVSERDVKETEKEKARLKEEELELARKAEELARREEKLKEERAAAEKERLQLEQKAKAKEAEERKRRKAEKAQERAEFKARKEAEMKEKKKAKKDKKKGPADSSGIGDGNATAMATADTDSNASDNPRDVEVPQQTAPKRISRPAAAIKQLNRVQPMPAPLRNRGKRKMRQYILAAVAILSVLALFMLGNYIPRLKSLRS